jgi:hypothetical protein
MTWEHWKMDKLVVCQDFQDIVRCNALSTVRRVERAKMKTIDLPRKSKKQK